MGNPVHVYPVEDAVEHDTADTAAGCLCGPLIAVDRLDDGTTYPLIIHHSLDCREVEWVAVDAPA